MPNNPTSLALNADTPVSKEQEGCNIQHPTSSDIAIKVSNLTKVYHLYNKPQDRLKEALNPFKKSYHHDFYAMNDVSFEIKKGETVGIIGKNGAGKSTLLKMITGILTPTFGSVEVNGKIASLLELGAGFNPEMSGLENIYLNGTLMGFSKEEMDTKVDAILEFADIGEFIYQPVKMYSSGMFARLAFSVSINVDPDILIIDEALSVGDMRFQLKCMDKFNEFREAGKTVLFVTHDINSIKRFCTFSLWIKNGQLESIGNTDQITDRYIDYLKVDTIKESEQHSEEPVNNTIAEVKNLIVYHNNQEIQEIQFGTDIEVEVTYEVFEQDIKEPVLGLAIHSIDHQYICGLNTLLDGVTIPWEPGINKFRLKYINFNLTGGSYHFDVALFEKNASVSFDYKAKYKTFIVHASYIGEGTCILNHKWKET